MAWFTRSPSGKWKASYRDPQRRIRSRTFTRKADAERWAREMETALDRGMYTDPSKGKEPLQRFFEQYICSAQHLRPKTLESYEGLARNHILPRLGHRPIGQIHPLEIRGWLSELDTEGVSPATARAAFAVLRLTFTAAVESGAVGRNPATLVKPPKAPTREMRFLTADDVARIVDAIGPEYRALVLILAYSGIRVGEAIALRIDNLDLLRNRVVIVESAGEVKGEMLVGPTKTGTNRSITLPTFVSEELAAHLAAYPSIEGRVFSNSRGDWLRQSNFIRRVWYPAVIEAKIAEPLPRVHDLRHTSVAMAVEAGAHPKTIQARLGHASITVTLDRYGHRFPSLDEALAEQLDAVARHASQPQSRAHIA